MRRLRTESGAEERIAVASSRLFHAVFLLWFSFLFLLTLGKMDRPGQGLLTSLLGTFFALTMFSLFGKKLEALSDRTMGACLALAAAAVFAGCLLLGSRMLIEPFNDTGSVYYSVAEIFETGKISKEINAYTCCEWATYSSNHDYFLIYKNSLFMVWYLYRYFWLLAFFCPPGVELSRFLHGCGAVRLSGPQLAVRDGGDGFWLFDGEKEGRQHGVAGLSCLVCRLFALLSHAYKAYSDSLSLPYVTLAVLLYVCAADEERKRGRLLMALSGLALAVDALLKGSVYILLIAEAIHLLFQKQRLAKKLASPGSLLAASMAVVMVCGLCLAHSPWLDRSNAEELEFPAVHWVMMAAKGSGGYRQEDFDDTASFPGGEAKKQADTAEYLRRVRAYGSARGYLTFQANKLAAVLASGQYAQSDHLSLAIRKGGRLWELVFGSHKALYTTCLAAYSCVFYLALLAALGAELIRPRRELDMLLNVCLFGVFLFFSFWEVKSRYLFNYPPLLMMNTVLAWRRLTLLSDRRASARQQRLFLCPLSPPARRWRHPERRS